MYVCKQVWIQILKSAALLCGLHWMGRQRGLWRADWVKGEIEFHKIRETEKETEMVETNFLPSPGLLQGRILWVGKTFCKLEISPYIQQLVQFTLIWAVNVYSFRSLNTYMCLNVQFKRHEHMEFWYYFDTSNMCIGWVTWKTLFMIEYNDDMIITVLN